MTDIHQFRKRYAYQREEGISVNLIKQEIGKLRIPKRREVGRFIFNIFPILSWLPQYNIKESLIADVISGITVGVMQIPQGMAYALLANQHAVYGLYSGFFPVLIYSALGTSRHLSMGTNGLTSLMLGASVVSLVPDPILNRNNTSHEWDNVYSQRIMYAAAMSFIVGLLLIAFSLFHLGIVTKLFPRPLISGFIFAASVLTMISQLKTLFGVSVRSYSGPLTSVYVVRDVIIQLTSLNAFGKERTAATVVLSLICIIFLVGVRIINDKYRRHFPLNIPIPGEIIVVIVGTAVSGRVNLKDKFNIIIIGEVPRGLPSPAVPDLSKISSIFGESVAIAILGYVIAVSLSQTFAEKAEYTIKPNQEMFAIGASNLFASFFFCIPCFTAMSRTCVQFESGGKTQLVGFISALLMLLVLLVIGPVFQYIPNACLASIVVVAVWKLLLNARDVKIYWTNQKLDSMLWLATAVSTILLDITLGLIVGICFALLCVVIRSSYVTLRKLRHIDVTNVYRIDGYYKQEVENADVTNDDVTVLQFGAPLNYLNSANLRKGLIKLIGVDPIAEKLRLKERRRNEMDMTETGCVVTQQRRYVILECSGMTSIDSVAVAVFQKTLSDYKAIDVIILIAACPESVLDTIGDVGGHDVTEVAYLSIGDAIKAAK
uniref:solute carrier family 26 member 6-like isoform X1 n=1 Tax=Ciona intestinalis TaxID=7719 RepID=UPI000180C2E6|nr:solute carrier family 26 member 6-like isoform X1 [Ciona intestinalis]XP_018670487.1 solute carrier family 26 member 6-like isoform X1 [Ciona intestinalis]XP_026693375.1 solute carrier family 26 member 6-like isoform X1 [Ciona intestinalis]XP_026693376.1 solute carrier family 26 member 6-like isoform X1 [Ciona intestinalis]XP_026693377.1 solute carrier family 26 member 6-like isoform X1 [Ciona intestinalis]|eukprot:XP_002124747.1 solute carrier family 26 member 6-like isoform X1 [Ciona intestinalis]